MPAAGLLDLAKQGDLDQFETVCLEHIGGDEAGALKDLVRPFQKLERGQKSERVATLAMTILENGDVAADAKSAYLIARSALFASPKSDDLRQRVVELCKKVYDDTPGFEQALEASGLSGERPARAALKLLAVYLDLEPGDTLIGRMDDRAVKIVDIDRENGILTLKRQDRNVTIPAAELAREYDRVDASDFRVLRQLQPEKLATLIEKDPVELVVGLLHAHGESMDSDQLKNELVPRYVEVGQWSKWWTKARPILKRATKIRVEGRSPLIMSLQTEAVSLEDEAKTRFAEKRDPDHYLEVIESYYKDKTALKEEPNAALLAHFHEEIVSYAASIVAKRPAEALGCALVLQRLAENGMQLDDNSKGMAKEILAHAGEPVRLISRLTADNYWSRAIALLPEARPEDALDIMVQLLPKAPATQLDALAKTLIKEDRAKSVEELIELAENKPLEYPEVLYWLWKNSKTKEKLDYWPTPTSLLRRALDTWTALGRAAGTKDDQVKHFRLKMRAAFALKDHAILKDAIENLDEAAAVTVRRQLERIDGFGDTLRSKALELLRDVHPHLWQKRRVEIQPWQDDRVIYSTQLGVEKKVAERDDIENVKLREIAVRIGEAASHGDLSENSEYKFALEERDLLRARLARINEDLSKAQAIDPLGIETGHIGIGTRVTFKNTTSGQERTMTFFGPFDTNVDAGTYSYLSPFAQGVMGAKLNEKLTLTLDGSEVEYEVVKIESAL
ncbi:MAG: GreA/GreB family elongation factor [Phycisphaerae bacterium]